MFFVTTHSNASIIHNAGEINCWYTLCTAATVCPHLQGLGTRFYQHIYLIKNIITYRLLQPAVEVNFRGSYKLLLG